MTDSAAPASRRPPVPWRFFTLTFAISWGAWACVAVAGGDIFHDLELGTVVLFGGFGPSIAGAVLIHRSADPSAIPTFWRRVWDPRLVPPLWVLPIFALYPAVLTAASLLAGAPLDLGPAAELMGTPARIPSTLLFVLVFGPLAEELGWRGHALDRLKLRFGPLRASLVLGLAWGVWHLPLVFVEGAFMSGLGTDPVLLAGYIGTVVLYSILFTWIHDHTSGSVLAAIGLHFSINATHRLVAIPALVHAATAGVLFVVCAVVVGVWFRTGRSCQRPRI